MFLQENSFSSPWINLFVGCTWEELLHGLSFSLVQRYIKSSYQ